MTEYVLFVWSHPSLPGDSLLMPPKLEGHGWIGLDESILTLYNELDEDPDGLNHRPL
jgi:hypothetical protein